MSKIAKALMAGTCLAGAGGVASATTYVEGISAPGGDFPSTLNGTLLPVGTTLVQGHLSWPTSPDPIDVFEWSSLSASASFTLGYDYDGFDQYSITLYDGAGVQFDFRSVSASGSFTGDVVPSDGAIIVRLASLPGSEGNNYNISFSEGAAPAPEPGTLGLSGLAVAGALVWRRRRKEDAPE